MNKKIKINIDRNIIPSEEIASRRNFESVLIQAKAKRKPFYKNPGFIGSIILGLALLSLLVWKSGSNNPQSQRHKSSPQISRNNGIGTVPSQATIPAHNVPSPKHLGHVAPSQPKRSARLASFKGLAPGIPFTIYSINASQNSSFTHGKGSIVEIPAGSFRRIKDKKVVTGPIDIHYREFSDAYEILIAGIPMQYDTAGQAHHLESAGMMEIRGFQNGEALEFVPGKTLKVSLASNIASTDYNVYQLKDASKQWAYRGKDTVRPMRVGGGIGSDNLEENPYVGIPEIFKAKAVKPVKKKQGRQNFKLTLTGKSRYKWPYYNGVYFELSPKSSKIDQKHYEATWNDVLIAPGRDSTLLKVKFVENIWRKIKNSELTQEQIRTKEEEIKRIKMQNGGKYETDSPNHTYIQDSLIFEVEAYPVYDGKDSAYVMDLYEKQVAKQKEEFEARQKEKERQRKLDSIAFERMRKCKPYQATNQMVFRAFSIANFGIYNCDRLYIIRPNKSLYFHLVDEQGASINATTLSLVYPSVRSVFTYFLQDRMIDFNDRTRMILITVTPTGDIAYTTSETFPRLPEHELTLKLKVRKNDFKTTEELKNFLMGL